MELRNIYDNLENDFLNIDKNTVVENTEVDTENVKKIFSDKLCCQNTDGKVIMAVKKRRKIRPAIAIAIIILIFLLGTICAGATGTFDMVFGENFAGNRIDGVYSGGNVNITSAQGYQTNFIGISGDYHSIAAAMNITKKDGSSFIKSDDVKYTYIMTIPYGIVGQDDKDRMENQINDILKDYNENIIEFYHQIHYGHNVWVEKSRWSRLLNSNKASSDVNSIQYFLTSPDNIKCVMRYDDSYSSLVGQKMFFENDLLFLYNVKEELGTCSSSAGYAAECLAENGETYYGDNDKYLIDRIAERITDAKKNLGKNEDIVKHVTETGDTERVLYCVAEINIEALKINGSCRLNYRSPEHKPLSIKSNTFYPKGEYESYDGHLLSDVTASVQSIDAGTFNSSVKIKCTGNTDLFDFISSDGTGNKWYDQLKLYMIRKPFVITLENGRIIYGHLNLGSWKVNNDGSVEFTILYTTKNEQEQIMPITDWVSIAPEEITAITFDGYVII